MLVITPFVKKIMFCIWYRYNQPLFCLSLSFVTWYSWSLLDRKLSEFLWVLEIACDFHFFTTLKVPQSYVPLTQTMWLVVFPSLHVWQMSSFAFTHMPQCSQPPFVSKRRGWYVAWRNWVNRSMFREWNCFPTLILERLSDNQ